MINKKIILLIPPQEKFSKDYIPSLGVGYVAANLEKNGYKVKIIDSHTEHYDNSITIKRILEEDPSAVGVTGVTQNRFNAIEIIRELKKQRKDLFIFVGGRHFHHTSKSTLSLVPEIDVIVKGEGEITAVELLDNYFNKGDFSKVLGIVYCKDREIISTPERPLIKNLDELPVHAWHLFDLSKYDATLEGEYKTRSIGVISSRGCPNQCTFCANASFWNTLRLRSPKNFVDEVEFLYKNYNYQGFDFWDDTITLNRNHIFGICQEIINRGLDIIWYARARVNTIDEEMLRIMRKAGCRIISFGVESGSENILKNIKKNITLEQIKKAFELSAKLGFITKAFFMFSLPGEKLIDIKETNKLIYRLLSYGRKYRVSVYIEKAYTLIYPGTEIEKEAIKEGCLDKNFNWNKKQKIKRSVELNLNPHIPVYENKDLPIEKIKEFNRKLDLKPNNILRKTFYQLSQIKKLSDLRRVYKLIKLFIKKLLTHI